MDPVGGLERVLSDARALVDAVAADDLTKRTPCTAWDVRALVEHMLGVVRSFTQAYSGGPAAPPAAPGTLGVAGDELRAAYGQAADALLAAVRAPGALDRTITPSFGEISGRNGIGIVLADQLIHCWDLARALGRSYTMDEGLAAATLDGLRGLVVGNPQARGEGKAFAEEVPCPEDASAQDRLLAFSGRRP